MESVSTNRQADVSTTSSLFSPPFHGEQSENDKTHDETVGFSIEAGMRRDWMPLKVRLKSKMRKKRGIQRRRRAIQAPAWICRKKNE